MTSHDETVQQSGLNEKLRAVQQYTQALQELATHLDDAKHYPRSLIDVLCLMAYFEVRLEIATFRITDCDSSDCFLVVQWQSACLYQAFKSRYLLFADPLNITRCHRCSAWKHSTCITGRLFTVTEPNLSYGSPVSSALDDPQRTLL